MTMLYAILLLATTVDLERGTMATTQLNLQGEWSPQTLLLKIMPPMPSLHPNHDVDPAVHNMVCHRHP